MSGTCQAVVLEAPERLALHSFPLPQTGEEDGLLRVELAGVCGTDPKYYAGRFPGRTAFPLILGHEIVGRIVDVGRSAAERWHVAPGQRVVVDAFLPCGSCSACQRGDLMACSALRTYGTRISCETAPHLWGGYSQYLYLDPRAQVYPVPDHVAPGAALSLCAYLANGIRWTATMGALRIGDRVLVQGVGPQGLASVIAARVAGAAEVWATGLGRDRRRLAMACRLGADAAWNVEEVDVLSEVLARTDGGGVDLVVDVTGAPQAAQLSIRAVRKGGRIVTGGLTGGRPVDLPVDELVWKEVSWVGAYSHDVRAVEQARSVVASQRFPLEELVTHVYPLSRAEEALRVAGGLTPHEDPIKVAVDPFAG